ncbi:MAG: hypothetical protein K6G85_08690, partial [Eubacterium sp.]|nr:hypothetical protein [Eubacterium sp.]
MKKINELKQELNKGFEQLSPKADFDAIPFTTAEQLSSEDAENIFGVKKKSEFPNVYRYSIVCTMLIVLLVSTFFGNRVNGYTAVLIQVNPSIELQVRNDVVEKIEAKNNDAVPIAERIEVGKSLDETVDDVIGELYKKHYFDDGKNDVHITVSGKNKEKIERQVVELTRKKLDGMGAKVLVKTGQKNEGEKSTSIEKMVEMKKTERQTEDTGTEKA